MWNCTRCFEEIDEAFDVCWNCGTDRSGKIDESFETADAPTDEPIEVTRIAADELLRDPIVIRNADYGVGSVVGSALFILAMAGAAVLVYFRLESEEADAKPYLLAALAGMFLLGCWCTYSAFTQCILGVELGKELTVRRMFGTSHYPLSDIAALELNTEIRMSIWVTLLAGGRRMASLVLHDGQRLRFVVDRELESRLRRPEVIFAAMRTGIF